MQTEQKIAEKLAIVLPHLNEKQRRLLIAAEARTLGWGGISQVAKATGVSRVTIHKALTRLLVEKGIFTKEEFLGMVRIVDREMKREKQ